jgi:hypothetical protein
VRFRAFAIASIATFAVAPALAAPAVSTPAPAAHKATASPGPATHRALPVIRGSVGPGFTISVSRHQANPRRYKFVVRDRSSMHNWHIRGPGVDVKTRVPFTGRKVFRVRLRSGTYRIVCDPHSSMMHTRIVVG